MDLTKPLMYDISEIFFMSKNKADDVYKEIHSGKITFDSAAGMYTQRPGFREKKGRMGFANTTNKLAEIAHNSKLKINEYTEVTEYGTGFVIIKLHDIDPARRETFEEALPRISAAVQAEYIKWLETE
jgi:parvulin-like peptidyl-prolyl isomerase